MKKVKLPRKRKKQYIKDHSASDYKLAAFQELYKLHADIHNFIERGIGIDKTIAK